MEKFDYIQYVNKNPLLKETDGYGSYKNPKTMLEFDGQDDFYINVSVRDAKKALEILRDEFSNEIRNKTIQLDGSDHYVINDLEVARDLYDALKLQDIEIIDHDVFAEDPWDDEYLDDEDREEEMFEYVSDEEFDTMNDDELDAAEKDGRIKPSNQPLGPDEETLENEATSFPRAEFSDAVHAALKAGLTKEELHSIVNFGG